MVDLAEIASADGFIEVDNAHVSGVSVITGGHGLRRFLSDLSEDKDGRVAITTTLNSAGAISKKWRRWILIGQTSSSNNLRLSAYERLGLSECMLPMTEE